MKKHLNIYQRVFLALWLISLVGCSQTCREWVLMETITPYPCFNSGCLTLGPDSKSRYTELVLCRNGSGLQLYMNVLNPPDLAEGISGNAVLSLKLDGEEPFIFYPSILDGMQRLLFSKETTEYIIELLLAEQTFVITAGRESITVIPDHFEELYNHLLEIPLFYD